MSLFFFVVTIITIIFIITTFITMKIPVPPRSVNLELGLPYRGLCLPLCKLCSY